MGDFSENVGYQLAKGRLRGINSKILEFQDLLNRAEIIKTNANSGQVELGNIVTLENEGQQKKYQILGSAETNPDQGIISHNSPLGSALLGKKIGDILELPRKDKKISWKIIDIK
jgi:transcription elongation factor GreA